MMDDAGQDWFTDWSCQTPKTCAVQIMVVDFAIGCTVLFALGVVIWSVWRRRRRAHTATQRTVAFEVTPTPSALAHKRGASVVSLTTSPHRSLSIGGVAASPFNSIETKSISPVGVRRKTDASNQFVNTI